MFNPEVKAGSIISRIQSEFGGRGFGKAVIGLSGGVDSAVSVALTAKAIGADNITCVRMPYQTSDPMHLKDAALVANQVGIKPDNLLTRDISLAVDGFIRNEESITRDRVRLGNICARCRMITLFDVAKKEKGMVVGTENRTENLFGYYTRFGDAASDIEPITSLYKTQVWEMAKWLSLPQEVIKKTPSADLWQGQTDEEELGIEYTVADKILELFFDECLGVDEVVAKGFEEAVVLNVLATVERNSFKKDLPVCLE